LVLVGCGLLELAIRPIGVEGRAALFAPLLLAPQGALGGRLRDAALVSGVPLAALASTGTIGDLVWMASKVGALSFGGGFVIVPLTRGDAVQASHLKTN